MARTETPNSLHVKQIDYYESNGDLVETITLRDGTTISIATPTMHGDATTGYSIIVLPKGEEEGDAGVESDIDGNINVPAIPGFDYDLETRPARTWV